MTITTIEEFDRRQARDREKFVAALALIEELKAAMPDLADANIPSGFMHTSHADATVQFQVHDPEEAKAIVHESDPIPMVRVRGTFLSFVPITGMKKKHWREKFVQQIEPFIYRLDYGHKSTVEFYRRAGDRIVQVDLQVTGTPKAHRLWTPGTKYTRGEWRLEDDTDMFQQFDRYATASHAPTEKELPQYVLWNPWGVYIIGDEMYDEKYAAFHPKEEADAPTE